ncbi:bifunctional proline dehydrogenase/L-glutamate gamma-semialdehyde dehydrogenase PutA [Pararhodobacter zhoushanensis]|uniref:bifunctional proline dehydrogenase/L-glutamate gamma-semialdehyde dehydrogenase PutA n=1 Tax=Pararhodobacter zhoushanensis TaxID=2479545 RepID=UPI000F8D7839|nr:bifunctional proline dehydrogenase/L-glutamate gamma-semialdehyde dehydrogenase PutA [Pararhodobacter zhoushanensis]
MPTDPLLSPLPQDEAALTTALAEATALDPAARARITTRAADLVRAIRSGAKPGLMEVFLAEYGLSTDEGIALMCLAEALLRVPDAGTMDALIEDKIAPSDWGKHLGHSASSLVNASTWALMLTGRVLDEAEPGIAGQLRGAVKRLGEPVIRTAVSRAMKEMGRQFVLGETIASAMSRASAMEARGYAYSYDMLGEAARTEADALRYQRAYAAAIEAIGKGCKGQDIKVNPGISVKLSALHPRYEEAQRERVMRELVPRVITLARMAARRGMGFNIDAEEQDRLVLSRDVIGAVLADPALEGWDGFGVVVQAYGPRAGAMIDWLYAEAGRLDRRLMVRLVKGAYWDSEIKRAQVLGLPGFPVFTAKTATDISYAANARKLLGMTDRLYPQFATHNAQTVATVLEMAQGQGRDAYEFQRLHGMGERLHDLVLAAEGTRCRIYAPVGAHRDLLAYLVRRLLENGANSSFVHKIVDESVSPEDVVADPLEAHRPVVLTTGPGLFAPERVNSTGWDLTDAGDLAAIETARAPFAAQVFAAGPLLAGPVQGGDTLSVGNPARPGEVVGQVVQATAADVETALGAAQVWDASPAERAAILSRAADLYERDFGPLFAVLAREAGKTQADCVGELREAVDFLRYYAARITPEMAPRGRITCISPWNFPLAIFTGQVAGALAAGNAVMAKPAEQTPLVAAAAVALLHEAGVPRTALQLLPGEGAVVGAALTSDPRVDGVVFTGSTDTAQAIRRAMAANLAPGAPLIAETGGLNAMIVDSTALPEQAVRDVVASAFQSAGQRCSALRCLYVQQDVAPHLLDMLGGAMEALTLGDPWVLANDVGPVIDAEAAREIRAYVSQARKEGRVLHELRAPSAGHFIAPVVIEVTGIEDIPREIFGPVLHVARFKGRDLLKVLDAVNARGFGLTFGLHTRIDNRVQEVVEAMRVGNLYVNRNQIGAVVGSQPFGGEGLSGTGPKAGGPEYVARLAQPVAAPEAAATGAKADLTKLARDLAVAVPQEPLTTLDMPGPTGESNRLSLHARPPVLCMGPGPQAEAQQAAAIRAHGGVAVMAGGVVPPEWLETAQGLSGVIWWGDTDTARACAQALSRRKGPILPLITTQPDAAHALTERHLCIDTTASGGNAQLLVEAAGA